MRKIRQSIGGLGNIMFKQAYIYAQMRKGLIPDIYVQSEKYWEEYADEIKQMFSSDLKPTDMVSIHIRRGDYLNTDFYVDLPSTDYYEKAIREFPIDTKFLVFYKDRQDPEQDSEDMIWCDKYLEKLIPGRFEMWQGTGGEVDDLNKMASCISNIGANSSFSWWGCYLNQNPKKKCIMPSEERWFSDGISRISLPNEWIRL